MLKIRSTFIVSLSLVILPLSCFVSWVGAEPARISEGVRLFKDSDLKASRQQFTAALKANPRDAAALRWLGRLEYYQNDETAALDHLCRSIQLDPAGWQAPLTWESIITLEADTGRHEPVTAAAKAIIASPGASPALKSAAAVALSEAAYRLGDRVRGQKLAASLGAVRQWMVIGPFDNVSQSGFENQFAPEGALALTDTVSGKDDIQLRWHPLGTVDQFGMCDLYGAVGDRGENAFYAVTSVQSKTAQQVTASFVCTGAAKIFCNGRTVMRQSVYWAAHEGEVEPFQVKLSLNAGWNTILVKVCDTVSLGGSFRLRLLDRSGSALQCPVAPAHSMFVPIDGGAPAVGGGHGDALSDNHGTQTAIADAVDQRTTVAEPGDDFEKAILVASVENYSGDSDAAIARLRAATLRWPKSAALHYELSAALLGDSQSDEAATERDVAIKLAPDLILAQLQYLAATDTGLSPAEARARLKLLAASNPKSPDVLWALADSYGEAKLGAQALAAARGAVRLAGGGANVVRLADIYESNNRSATGRALVAQAQKADPTDPDLLDQLADNLQGENKMAEAIKVFEQNMMAAGPTFELEQSIAQCYLDQGNTSAAIARLKLAYTHHPQSAWIATTLGDLLQEAGKGKEAVGYYQDAIKISPASVQLREKLQILQGQKAVINLANPLPSPKLTAIARSKPSGVYSSELLMDDGRTVVYPDYATLTRFHTIVRVNDKLGVEQYQAFPIARPTSTADVTIEAAKLYKTDGKVEDDMDNASGSGVSFPSLAPGDVIDVTYRVEDLQRGGLAGNFWTNWFLAGPGQPSKSSRFALITPAGMSYRVANHGSVPQPVERTVGRWRIAEWTAKDIPAMSVDPGSVGTLDARSWIDVSTFTSWGQIVSWYRNLSGQRCMPDAAVRAKALELTRDCHSDEEKTRSLISYVRGLQYQSSPFRNSAYIPTEGKQVIRERYGDCKDKAALLVSLLNAVGIRANMALLSPRSVGTTPYLPSPRFDHAIACVETAHGPMWVDATADQLAIGELPDGDQGVSALLIAPDTRDLTITPLMSPDHSVTAMAINGTLTGDGNLKATAEVKVSGTMAWYLRSVLQRISGDRQSQLMDGITTAWFGDDAHCDGGTVEELGNPDVPMTLKVQFHAENVAKAAGDYLLVTMPWTHITRPAALDKLDDPARQSDYEVGPSRGIETITVDMTMPAGYSVQDIPPSVSKSTEWIGYSFSHKLDGMTLHSELRQSQIVPRIAKKDLPEYTRVMRALQKEVQKAVLLKKTGDEPLAAHGG